MRWDRDMVESVRGDGDGEGVVVWSESREPCSSSSPADRNGSNLGRLTASSALMDKI